LQEQELFRQLIAEVRVLQGSSGPSQGIG